MVPVFRSPRLQISILAVLQLFSGLTFLTFNRELFNFLQAPLPPFLMPFRVYGAISVVFGLGLFLAARNPLKSRRLLLLIACCKAAAGVTSIVAAIQEGMDPAFTLIACVCDLAPAAWIVGVVAQFASLRPSPTTSSSPLVRASLPLMAMLAFLAAGIASQPLIEAGRTHGWLAPLAVTGPAIVTKALPKNASWNRLPSQFPLTPGAGLAYRLVPAFGDVKFTDPTFMVEIPGRPNHFLVSERTGRIVHVDGQNECRKTTFLDLRAVVHYGPFSPEEGLLSFALHPGYADPQSPGFHSLFLFFTRMWEGKSCNCVSRFQVQEDGSAVDPSSESLIFCQAYKETVHHGGGLAFGPDGFLYIGVGDGWWGSPNGHAQRIDKGFFSGILRVDVDRRGGEISHPILRPPENGVSANYFVPNDNPFLAPQGENLEEFYAIGFRNPWRISFDRQSGELWVADSGFERREEINRVSKGDNGGWAYLEGSVPTQSYYPDHLPRPAEPLGREIAPVFEYPRSMSYCTVGGFLYRGKQLPSLAGKYVYGDVSGDLAALTLDAKGVCIKNSPIGCVPQPLMALCSLAEDSQGELYVLATKEISREEGQVYKIVAGPAEATKQLPTRLSDTGLFADMDKLTPHAALTGYDINVPFWSDNAIKTRFVGTQSGLPIQGQPRMRFQIPAGTVFVKHFDFALDLRKPDVKRKLETRVLVFTLDRQWYGLTYRWDEKGADARLVEDAETETLLVTQKDGAVREQVWQYPDRHSCLSCHNSASEGALGFSYKQLWRDEGGPQAKSDETNQLHRLRAGGVLTADALYCNVNDLSRLAATRDPSRSLEERARSYLDANCSYCHRNGVWYSTFDLRYDTPLDQSQLLSEPLLKHYTDWSQGKQVSHTNQAKAVRAGSPEDSFIYRRLNTTEAGRRMPPIGRTVVDEEGAQLIREWILSLEDSTRVAAKEKSP